MATDFFGNQVDDDFDPLAPAKGVKTPAGFVPETPEQRTIRENQRIQDEKRRTASPVMQANNAFRATKTALPSPLQWGFDQASPAELQAAKDQAVEARKERDGGLWGDLGRLGLAGARTLVNPVNALIGDYLPEEGQAIVGGPGYFADAALDEFGDRTLPGGSGSYGSNIIPGQEGTGGDSFYASETGLSGSYADGYRGTNSPRAAPTGAGTGAGAGDAASPDVLLPERPDSYRTDTLNGDIRALLASERQAGPSEAEALLTKATDRVAAQALGIAAGARGGAGARERAGRQARAANVALGAEAGSNLAALRAREDQARRQRVAELMGLLQTNAGAGDARDLGYYQSDQNYSGTLNNIAAADRRAAASDQLSRDQFNASRRQSFGEDPLGWLTGRPTTGSPRI